jgi:D-xylulose reductase
MEVTIMQALVLEKKGELSLRDIAISETLGPRDLKIAIHTVGICGSDVHYYTNGAIGQFIVRAPMVLGHEASGTVLEAGSEVKEFKPGDRVCMEPGIPDPRSRASRLGLYNLDPAVRFWATPPIHGCLRETVIHPADYTFKLPENVSFGEGAMVEPLAVGMHAATKAGIRPGDTAVVVGAGTIGIMTALAALGGGASRVIITDVLEPKLAMAGRISGVVPVNVAKKDGAAAVKELTGGWGADIVFEASGSERAIASVFDLVCPGGRVVLIGIPLKAAPFDVGGAQVKEARIETIFRYAHMYPRALALMESGKIDLKPFITATCPFKDSIKAFDAAASDANPAAVKDQIVVADR